MIHKGVGVIEEYQVRYVVECAYCDGEGCEYCSSEDED
jgi:hypothetical protein